MRPVLLIAPLCLLAACDSGEDAAPDPASISEGEMRALEEAADMLDETRLPEGALPETEPSGQETGDPSAAP